MKVSNVFLFPNGMVAVTGPDGQQIGELQGRFEDVRAKVEAAADEETEWNGWPERRTGPTGSTTSHS